ncbi:glycosyltransferase [Echinicola strongylocentroti]|nr:glycosyltransferase [Echinicola strongylocentroti]
MILVFDPQLTGHHSEYIGHLVEHIYQRPQGMKVTFVVHPEFASRFPDIRHKAKRSPEIEWIGLHQEEISKITQGNMASRSNAEFRIMDKYATTFQADHVIALYFNTIQLALSYQRPRYSISGILFLQFFRMERGNLKDKLKYYRKYLTTWLYTKNKRLTKVFILNDDQTVDFLNTTFRTSIFEMLSDPIPNLKPLEGFDIYSHYKIPPTRKILLHIGSLGDRKGTYETLASTRYIDKEAQADYTLLLVGKVRSKAESVKLNEAISACQKETDCQIIWDEQFVSNDMMKSLFDRCDVVLMPYKNPEASSGILGHAANSGKPVVTVDKGLLGHIVKREGLGVLVNNVDPVELGAAIPRAVRFRPSRERLGEFVKKGSQEVFADLLMTS